LADFERVDVDRLRDVLKLRRPEITDLKVEPLFHLPVSPLGKADGPGLGYALEPRGDVDAVAHEIAVALLDDIADMNADANYDLPGPTTKQPIPQTIKAAQAASRAKSAGP
jgi:hypothetical protein